MSGDFGHVSRMFSLGGMSECGKSEAGRTFAAAGVERLKIARFIEAIGAGRGYDIRRNTFTDDLFETDPQGTLMEFVDLVATCMKDREITYASLESMYRVPMAVHLKRVLGDRMVNIYVDTPFEMRVEREWKKSGQKLSREDTERRVVEKDEIKTRIGVPGLREVADILIDNSGPLEEYRAHLGRILEQYCPDVVG